MSLLSICPKLKQGQLLMQRYRLCFNKGNSTAYQAQADECKRKSVVLAKRMRDHADKCPNCSQRDPDFYGLIAMGV